MENQVGELTLKRCTGDVRPCTPFQVEYPVNAMENRVGGGTHLEKVYRDVRPLIPGGRGPETIA